MQLIFTKGSGKYDRMEVLGTDGSVTAEIDCPKQGIIPHDMVHYAIESTLRKRGFLGRLLDGEAASFQMASDSDSDGVERLVEVIQADAWSGGNSTPADILELYRVTCSARQSPPLDVSPVDIEAVRAKIVELTGQWQSVPVGRSLLLEV